MLSKRLKKIASLVNEYKVVYDVGSDHALLPCFLVMNELSPKVYAGDNKKGPLDSARKNIEKYGLQDKVIPILGDGLENAPDDSEIVIISGMGYYTVEHILDNADVSKYSKFIVEVNKDTKLLRKYLSDHNFTIINEEIVFDDFYYQIIEFNSDYHEQYSLDEIEYGPVLFKKKSKEFTDFLNYQISKLEDIYLKSKSEDILDQINKIKGML